MCNEDIFLYLARRILVGSLYVCKQLASCVAFGPKCHILRFLKLCYKKVRLYSIALQMISARAKGRGVGHGIPPKN